MNTLRYLFWYLSHISRCIYLLGKKGSVTSSQDSICKMRRYGDLSSLVYTHALNSFIQTWNDFRFHTHLPHECKTLIQAEGEREERKREGYFILIIHNNKCDIYTHTHTHIISQKYTLKFISFHVTTLKKLHFTSSECTSCITV